MNNFHIKIITNETQSFSENVENNNHINPLDKSLNYIYVLDKLHMTFSKKNFDIDKEQCKLDLNLFLNDLDERDLIEVQKID